MRKIGLVLSGGGAKGAYQIGVFKALEVLGLSENVCAISGASIGALNSALFIQYYAEEAEWIWKSINWAKVLQLGDQHVKKLSDIQKGIKDQRVNPIVAYASLLFMAKSCGLPLKRDGFKLALKKCIDFNYISNSKIDFFVGCEDIQFKKSQYFQLNGAPPKRIMDVLLASTAIPVIYDPVRIERSYYGDPLRIQNVPLTPMLHSKCETIIVVHLDNDVRHLSNPIYEYKEKLFIHIIPSQDIGKMITGSLDFSPDAIQRNIDLGYQDAMRILNQAKKNKDIYN